MSIENIAKKMVAIMSEVKYIQKTGFNSFHKYKYATEADVSAKCQEAMIAHKVICVPSVESSSMRETKTRSGNTEYIACVNMIFKFIDADSGESIEFKMSGEGQDVGDKAIYKAISGTQKYAYMKMFCIATGDDPEKDDEPETEPKKPTKPVTEEPAFSEAKPDEWKLWQKMFRAIIAEMYPTAEAKDKFEKWYKEKYGSSTKWTEKQCVYMVEQLNKRKEAK